MEEWIKRAKASTGQRSESIHFIHSGPYNRKFFLHTNGRQQETDVRVQS